MLSKTELFICRLKPQVGLREDFLLIKEIIFKFMLLILRLHSGSSE